MKPPTHTLQASPYELRAAITIRIITIMMSAGRSAWRRKEDVLLILQQHD